MLIHEGHICYRTRFNIKQEITWPHSYINDCFPNVCYSHTPNSFTSCSTSCLFPTKTLGLSLPPSLHTRHLFTFNQGRAQKTAVSAVFTPCEVNYLASPRIPLPERKYYSFYSTMTSFSFSCNKMGNNKQRRQGHLGDS